MIDDQLIRTLSLEDQKFLSDVMTSIESNWTNSDFKLRAFSKALGFSYSQWYRRLMKLTGKTANNFIKEFRLHQALVVLHNQRASISEIAGTMGFSRPTYFF